VVRVVFVFFFSSRRRHTRFDCDWSSDVCSSDLIYATSSLISFGFSFSSNFGIFFLPLVTIWTRLASLSVSVSGARKSCAPVFLRSEERRVGKECRSRWSPYH